MRKLLCFLTILIPFLSFGQVNFSNPNANSIVVWKLDKKKINDNTVELTATASIQSGYHIWDLDAGGDGTLINTSFDVEGIEDADEIEWTSLSKPQLVTLDFIEGTLRWHEKKAIFKAQVTAEELDINSLRVIANFQVCNESMCLPPQDELIK